MAILAVALCLLLASCGAPPPTTPRPSNPHTFTITSGGVNPKEMTVVPGIQVLFVNSDSRRHFMASDPHPEHTDCPEINAVGVLQPGQSRETSNLVMAAICGFHDHDNPPKTTQAGNIWTGRIIIR
jgi:plastocyanin